MESPAMLVPRVEDKAGNGSSPESCTGGTISAQLRELQREKRIADALVQFAEQAGETLELKDVLNRLCRLTVELMPADRCTIYLWSKRRHAYVPVADCGSPPEVAARF